MSKARKGSMKLDDFGKDVATHLKKHRTFNIQHSTFNIELPAPVRRPYWMLGVECWLLDVPHFSFLLNFHGCQTPAERAK
jgi:hypothetical protein